jgi:pyruvate-formate lyase
MKVLAEISFEQNFATADAARNSLNYARRFTSRFREVEKLDAASREAEMLRVQFPYVLRPPESGDLFVGKIHYPCLGVSPEPCGLGYYFDFAGVKNWMAKGISTPDEIGGWEELLKFWEPRVTQARTRAAYPPEVAALLPSDEWMSESGVAFPLYRMAGTVLDYEKLLALGLDGLAAAVGDGSGSCFRRACLSAIETLRGSIDHYLSRCTEPAQATMAETLRAIRHDAPRTFREAIQLLWLWVIHSGTWNYGRLDVILGPFLSRDLEGGEIDASGALEVMCAFWRLMHAHTNQYNNRVIIGGKGRPDEASADRFALLAIEATRRVRLNQPQLSLRFYKGQNPELWERALDAIGEGCTFPMLYNDDVNIPAVAKAFDVGEELAAQYTPFGCGEYVLSHHSVGTPNGVINLLKALEVVLHGGVDPLSGRRVVRDVPEASAFESFEDLWHVYASVVEQHIEALAKQEKIEYDVVGAEAAFPYFSMLTDDCLGRGRAIFSGGVRYLGGTIETYGNSNAADSLHVIEELVFRRREISLPELVAALDANFEHREDLRKRCLAIRKYGNDEATADAMARRVHEHICKTTRAQARRVGLDSYLVVIINNWANTVLGWKTGASAEGRRAGQPMANGNNPTPGADISGVTAFLNSLVCLDPSLHAGAVQNMKFSKEWFGAMRPKFDALLRAYFARGGTQAMVTVVSRDDLDAAMREPEKWGHLMIRVGGFSIRFVELPREAQLEVLERTLN